MLLFYWPWLGLLLPLPLLVWWLFPKSKKADTDAAPELLFPALDKLKAAFPTFKASPKQSRTGFVVLLSLIWLLLVLTVMRPQLVDQYSYIQNEGYDLMLAVDISGSMRALDFSTEENVISRLDVTKDVVSKFVRERQGDRVGLILFGEHAYLHVPLTLDTISVSHMLNNAVSGMAGDATSIGDAVGLAVRNLRERPEDSRVIILLTDGEDTASAVPPLEAAKLAKQYGIRIYTIGVGKDGPVPYPDNFAGVVMAELPMDEELLKDVAAETGGKYFLATDADTLENIYDTINTLEKSESEAKEYLIRQPLYRYPLGAACALFLILCLTPIYRRVAHGI